VVWWQERVVTDPVPATADVDGERFTFDLSKVDTISLRLKATNEATREGEVIILGRCCAPNEYFARHAPDYWWDRPEDFDSRTVVAMSPGVDGDTGRMTGGRYAEVIGSIQGGFDLPFGQRRFVTTLHAIEYAIRVGRLDLGRGEYLGVERANNPGIGGKFYITTARDHPLFVRFRVCFHPCTNF
jgi:hypothetical protein